MSVLINKLKLASVTLLSVYSFSASAQIVWPTATHQTKPWARWWWEGSAVNKKDLTWNMESYRAAGLGGLEITPIYGVKGHESEFIPFLSSQWMDMLQYTLQEGKRLDMGIDLANATGWPFGGPWVTDEDASKELFWKTYDLKSGERLQEDITFVQQPLIRSDGVAPKITDLVEPISANKNLQLMALDQVRFEKRLPLNILMAYNDKGEAINLTDKVNTNGTLDWTAPAGSNWHLYALFMGWHGKMVERAAPGGEGYVIDHFSKPALNRYLNRFDEAFKGRNINGIRAFFNDSYEVDDARGQSNFTPEFFNEFLKRRGYDLRNHLPALFGKADKEINNRVLCDYRETVSELLLDNFTKPWQAWGKSKGALIRNQSHGSPSNILDLYAAIDIPETEGTDILRFKFATSAAHVNGKPLASSESATWLNDHFLSSLGDVKQVIDKYFIGGVNHIFYHGVSYSPQNAPWPGWLFYAAVHFNQTNPFWPQFSTLNNYITRCQSFLQQGKPNNDVLIYYPLFDSFSEAGPALLKHYDALKPDFNGTGFADVSDEMLQKGYTFDFISDKQLLATQLSGNQLLTGGVSYKTVLLPDCEYIPLATFTKLMDMAKAGATIAFYKKLPSDVPGYNQLTERRKSLQAFLLALNFNASGNGVKTAVIGKGRIVMADNATALLNAANIKRESMTDNGLQFVRRQYPKGYYYFIANQSDKAVESWVPLAVKATSIALFDPMQKQYGLAKARTHAGGGTEVYLQLQPGESCILQTSNSTVTGNQFVYYKPTGNSTELNGSWIIQFMSGGPTLPPVVKTNNLKSWTELGGEETKIFSGMASYTTTFAKPKQNAAMWQLDLGKVHESADVYLNGVKLATLLGPKYAVNVPAALLKSVNRLEIKVTNLMANRIIDMDKKKISYKIFYNTNFQAHFKENRGDDGLFTAAKWEPQPSGLVGKVTLTPLAQVAVR
ncbi:glycoside hydrolase family 2 protein [Mucilaginibacter robiniae]|uniref:Glycoside hydrolase family 2 protein n=1 Tax=Mucilaginibacter robiniae TaxID=2728022 RepID=A0A7L5DYP8_9SPHI|nr:glycosyl hydrolase [Mucilaginibacter robiniae]QJD95237.1 glycoside hydrolase family 2 protein [Mucilaginibacter robiniae]